MSVASSQQQVFLRLLRQLSPHWRRDVALPRRIQQLLAGERAFGSRDRRLYRELIYTTLRYLNWVEPWLDASALPALRSLGEGEATTRSTLSGTAFSTLFALELIAWLAADLPATRTFRAAL